jgi:hypothetical protein
MAKYFSRFFEFMAKHFSDQRKTLKQGLNDNKNTINISTEKKLNI